MVNYGEPGYTIEIRKPRPYMTVKVWRDEIIRMLNWAMRYGAQAWIGSIPDYTSHKFKQYAKVTITDPVMRVLERTCIIRSKKSQG